MTPTHKFTIEPGYFTPLKDLQDASPIGRVTTQPRFGLLPRPYPTDTDEIPDRRDWIRFKQHVESLNRSSSEPNVSYKVLFLTRHGFGYHNKKEKEVGTPEWDRHWSLLDGADGETWFDALLTPEGVQQARDLSDLWLTATSQDGVPVPSTLYTSPLSRCLQTCHYSLSPLVGTPFKPTVREKLRERMTMHTCDKRHPRSWIQKQWPEYIVGGDVTEEDVLGQRESEETVEMHVVRMQKELDELFEMDKGQFLSLTTHSQAISSLMLACNADPPSVREGTTFAVLVRAEIMTSR